MAIAVAAVAHARQSIDRVGGPGLALVVDGGVGGGVEGEGEGGVLISWGPRGLEVTLGARSEEDRIRSDHQEVPAWVLVPGWCSY